MSVLRTIESKIEGLFEGVFGRAFRTHVQPVELARKLAKEMDEHRSVSVSRVYVPNEYTLYLSTGDREQFRSYEGSLIGELQEYLAEHARREGYSTLSSPRVVITTDDDLAVGEFGIATRIVQPDGGDAGALPALPEVPEVPVEAVPTATVVYRPPVPLTPETEATEAEPDLGLDSELEEAPPDRETVTLTIGDRVYPVTTARVVLGRSRECDVRIPDANVSRRHCEIAQEGASSWSVRDLGSTNGTELNGHKISGASLADGDRITIGDTDVDFGRSLA
jgi:hypothetical protein